VHSLQVLLEVIKSGPFSLMFWAAISKTLVLTALAMCWLDFVNTLLMSLKVIDCCETLRSCTAEFFAYMLLVVSSCMLPITVISANVCQCGLGRPT
jgi:hypothetical protein